MLKQTYQRGQRAALAKYALEAPTQVDAFMGAVESGKDVPPGMPALNQPTEPPRPYEMDGTSPLNLSDLGPTGGLA